MRLSNCIEACSQRILSSTVAVLLLPASCLGRETYELNTDTEQVVRFIEDMGAVPDWLQILRLNHDQLQGEVDRLNALPYSAGRQGYLACLYLAQGEARLASEVMQIQLERVRSVASESNPELESMPFDQEDLELGIAHSMAKNYLFLTLADLEQTIVEGRHECNSCDAYSMWPVTGTERMRELRLFVRAMVHAYGMARELCIATEAEQVNRVERQMAALGLIPGESLDPLLWSAEGNLDRSDNPNAFASNRTLMMGDAQFLIGLGYDRAGAKRLLGEPDRTYPRGGDPYRWEYFCGTNWIGDSYWLQLEFGRDGMARAEIAKL